MSAFRAAWALAASTCLAASSAALAADPDPEDHPEPASLLPKPLEVEVPADARANGSEPLLVFEGNVLFSDSTYRSLLALPAGTVATRELARVVATQIWKFLLKAGYDLATVHARVHDKQIEVEIDEGQLGKIVVFGGGIVETLRFKLELFLPANVFNRSGLEDQLRKLARLHYQWKYYSYELVPADVQESYGPQLESLEPALGLPGVKPGQRYDLHILIASDPWARGVTPELALDPVEGLAAGVASPSRGLLLRDDREELIARVAGSIRTYLDGPGSRPVFTHGLGQGRWLAPPVFTDEFRLGLSARADYWSLQRADLGLENYDQAIFASSVGASLLLARKLTLTATAGIERRLLFAIHRALSYDPSVDTVPLAQTRPFAELTAAMIFNPEELRTDRKHRLGFQARLYPGSPSSGTSLWLRADYRRRFSFGWHELWVTARGTYLAGQLLFPDEESIGAHLHGPFSTAAFGRHLASTGFEFRFSIIRDAFKVGVFYDQVLYGALDRVQNLETPQSAGAGGLALHLLLADEFQTDAYLAVGWRTGGAIDYAPTLTLQQVY